MFRARYFAAVVVWVALLTPVYAANKTKLENRRKLSHDIETILSDPDTTRSFWGVYVVSLDSGAPIFAHNQNKLFTPASNTKLFTTAAVLGLIGPDYRFKTTVETMGTVDKYGRLNGDLVIVGRGDPNLSGRTLPYNLHTERKAPPIQVLQNLADQLVQHGLKYIDGDVVADDSYFVFERYSEGWSQDDLAREWGAPVSALTINDNVIFVNIMPADRPGERAFLSITPFPEYYKIDNRVMTTPQGTGPRTVSINREPGSNQLTFWGTFHRTTRGSARPWPSKIPPTLPRACFASCWKNVELRSMAGREPPYRTSLDRHLQRDFHGLRWWRHYAAAQSRAAGAGQLPVAACRPGSARD